MDGFFTGRLSGLFEGNGLMMILLGIGINEIVFLMFGKTVFGFLMNIIPKPPEQKRIEDAGLKASALAERKQRIEIANKRFTDTKAMLPDTVSDDIVYTESQKELQKNGGILDIIKGLFDGKLSPVLLIGGAILVFMLMSGGFPGCSK